MQEQVQPGPEVITGDPVEAVLRELVEERHGPGAAGSQLEPVQVVPGQIARAAFSNDAPVEDALRRAAQQPGPTRAAVTAPEEAGSPIHRPDLSAVGEALDQNRVTGFLKRCALGYLNKFDPRGKDKKAWGLGIAGGALSVIAATEAGASAGLLPAFRGLVMFGVLQASNRIYEAVHYHGYLWWQLSRRVNNWNELRQDIIGFERKLASQKLSKEQVETEYNSEEFRQIILKNLQVGSWDELLSSYGDRTDDLVNRLTRLGQDYAAVNSAARSLAAGVAAGSLVGGLSEFGVRVAAGGTLGTLGDHFGIGDKTPQTQGILPPTATETPTPTATVTATPTSTATPTGTPSPLATGTPTVQPTQLAGAAETSVPSSTATATLTPTSTPTEVPSVQPSPTATETTSPTATVTATTTSTPSPTSTPAATVTPPQPIGTPQAPHIQLPEGQYEPGIDSIKTPVTEFQQRLDLIQNAPQYQIAISAEVGRHAGEIESLVSEGLKTTGLLAGLDHASVEAAKIAALHVMEEGGNKIFEKAATEVLQANPDATLEEIAAKARKAYEGWLTSADNQSQIAEAAHKAFADTLQKQAEIAQKVAGALNDHTDWYSVVPIQPGDTAGKILNLTWTPADAPVMGANIAANYGILKDMWANMAQFRPDLVSPGATFPVSLSEIPDLVARAEAGDDDAIRRLRQALRWIPSGSKLRAIAAKAAKEVLKASA